MGEARALVQLSKNRLDAVETSEIDVGGGQLDFGLVATPTILGAHVDVQNRLSEGVFLYGQAIGGYADWTSVHRSAYFNATVGLRAKW